MTAAPALQRFPVGSQASVQRRIEVQDLEHFAALSGDTSAIHTDPEAARARGFSGKVAHGLLLGSWVSAVLGTQLPGDCGLLQSITLNFKAPVIPPDTLTIGLEVTGVSEAVSQLKLSIRILRSDGTLAATGEARSIISGA